MLTGTTGTESCLADKLARLAPISDRERRFLADLEKDRREVDAGTVVFSAGEPSEQLFILNSGVAITYADFADGRSIAQIHFPGDILGVAHLPFTNTLHTCVVRANSTVCPFPKRNLDALLTRSPRLAGLLYSVAAIEEAMCQDRVRILSRRDAQAKLALYILQTLSRMKLMNEVLDDQFHSPLTQAEIGDAVGLTNIHVSRTFSRMEREGLIARNRSFVRILDRRRLERLASFSDRYAGLDLSWLPASIE